MTEISPDTASSLLAALERGESLPASFYTDPGVVNLEYARIFRRSWNYIGPLSELRHVGDYVTGMAGDVPVVVMRNEQGLAGFVNVCRHRRHIVMKGRGNAKIMQCLYHAWAYDLDGKLKTAPRSGIEPGFKSDNYPLLPARVETVGPWVFLNLDRDATAASVQFAGIIDLVKRTGIDLDTLELYSRQDWEARANWKTMLENYLECYHCPVAHPGFSAAIDVRSDQYELTAHGWYMSQSGQVRPAALEGKSAIKIYDARGAITESQYHLLWPNMTININPGFPNLSIDVWMPLGPNAAKGFSEQYFAPGVSKEFAEELSAFNQQVGLEDDVLTDAVQTGLIGGLPDQGRFLTNSEHLAVHFQKLVVNALRQDRAGAVPVSTQPVSKTIPLEGDISVAPTSERNAYVELEVFKVEPESEIISSFYLKRVDGRKIEPWTAGQFLPIRVTIPGQAQPVLRTYTLSCLPNAEHYRLSIRRGDDKSLVSPFLHANAKPGFRLQAMKPRGKFTLAPGDRPVVFLSGGVGLTPMIAMAAQLVEDGKRTGRFRPAWFIHGAMNSKVHAFGAYVKALAAEHAGLNVHVLYSHPGAGDKIGTTHDADGMITIDELRRVLPFGDYDFYLCGPHGFMQALYDGLTKLGVRNDRIHYESFGGVGAPLHVAPVAEPAAPLAGAATDASVTVRFAKSGVTAEWTRAMGSLLDLAETNGLAPAFGCRAGVCGTCKTGLTSGTVDYVEEPLADPEAGKILLCCSIPSAALRQSGGDGLVIDL